MRYNSSSVLQAASRIGCKQAIPSSLPGPRVKTRKFDQRTTSVVNLGGGTIICSTRVCESRNLTTSSDGACSARTLVNWVFIVALVSSSD